MNQSAFSYIKSSELGTGHDDGTVAIWDINKNKQTLKFENVHSEPCRGITFSPVNQMLMGSVSQDMQVIFFDIYKNRKVV